MRIKSTVKIATFITITVVLFYAAFDLFLDRAHGIKEQDLQRVTDLIGTFDQLRDVTTDYVLYRTERAKQQWWTVQGEILQRLNTPDFQAFQREYLLLDLEDRLKLMGDAFTRLTTTIEKTGLSAQEVEANREFRNRLITQIMLTSHEIVTSLVKISEEINDDRVSLIDQENLLDVIALFILGLLIVGYSLFLSRSVVQPVLQLHEDAEIIGRGNLDHQVATNGSGEIKELSLAFNEMTANLMKVTVSRDELVTEMQERQQAQEALRTSEERFRAFMNNSPAVAWAKDEAGQYVYFSKTFEDRFGVRLADWQGKTDFELWPQDLAQEFRQNDLTVLQAGHAMDVIERTRNLDGGLSYWWTFKFPFLDSAGVKYIGGIAVDVTERQQAQEDLLRSKERLDLLAATASQLLESGSPQRVVDSICPKVMDFINCDVFFNFLVDEKEGRLHLNSYAGIPEEEARRIEWLDYGVAVCGCAARDGHRIVAEDILSNDDIRTQLVKSYGVQAYACHPLLVEGRVLGTLSFGSRTRSHFNVEELRLMKGVADQVAIAIDRKLSEEALLRSHQELEQRVKERTKELQLAVESLQREMGERQEAEEALSKSEERFRALVTASSDVVYRMNADWSEMLQLHGRDFIPDMETPSQTWLQKYVPPEDRLSLETRINEAVRTKSIFELEHRVRRVDGSLGWTFSRAIPLLDKNGEILEWFGAASDVTERRQAEEALRESEQRLRYLASQILTAQEQERKLISMELHEGLGQYLAALKINLRTLQRNLPTEVSEIKEDFEGSHKLLKEMIEEVRRISRGLSPSLLENLGLTSALNHLLSEFSKYYEIAIEVNADDIQNLFSPQTEINLFRIFQESLTNIAKHAHASQVSVTIAKQDGRVYFNIKDNGVGFDLDNILRKELISKGMGLAAMEERLRMIGAKLNISSQKGTGTEISFSIPIETDCLMSG